MNAFILYSALFFAFTASPSTLCNGLMKKGNSETDHVVVTCWKTTDFSFCVDTLRLDPRSVGATVNGLVQVALDKLRYHVRETSDYLQDLDKSCSGQEKLVTGTCIHFYGLAVNGDVPFAMKNFNFKDYADAKKGLLAAMDDGGKCQGVIDKNPSSKWEMQSHRNEYMHNVSQLSNDLIKLLE